MQHVQNSEVTVENKKKHCKSLFVPLARNQGLVAHLCEDAEVVKAFQNALALLNDQMKI